MYLDRVRHVDLNIYLRKGPYVVPFCFAMAVQGLGFTVNYEKELQWRVWIGCRASLFGKGLCGLHTECCVVAARSRCDMEIY